MHYLLVVLIELKRFIVSRVFRDVMNFKWDEAGRNLLCTVSLNKSFVVLVGAIFYFGQLRRAQSSNAHQGNSIN